MVTFLTDEDKVLRYDAQDLTEEQKVQARENIGAVNETFVNDCIKSNGYKTIVTTMEPTETLEAYCILRNTGALTNLASGDKSYIVKKYDIAGASTVVVTASANMSNHLYSFCSAAGSVVQLSENAATGAGLTEIVEQAVEVPEHAATLYVSYIVSASNAATVQAVELRPIGDTMKWAGKKWVCIGDSLTATNQRTTMHYHDYVAEATGISVVNMGSSGTGYAKGGTNTFYGRIANVPTDADIVTIFGSGNDLSAGLDLGEVSDTGTETLCGCINTTIDNLITRMPTIQLGIVTPTPWVGQQPGAGKPMEAYADAIVEICKARSIPVLDLYHCSNLRPWTEEGRSACYTKDDGNGVHPDETGHKLIAPRFKAFLEGLLL
jgi:lysophospholipase L1-like esterase